MSDNPSRIMPERWFFGDTYNSTIMGVIRPHGDESRPLADGERCLGSFIVPSFQRQPVWTERQKVRLIESLYIGMPIGAIVWNQTHHDNPCDGWLLDGQQRVTAIQDYVEGRFAVLGWLYPDLPDIEKRHFHRMSIAVVQTGITDEAICRDVYDRLAYGGTVHDEPHQKGSAP